jgi:MSHA pilin protein MshC
MQSFTAKYLIKMTGFTLIELIMVMLLVAILAFTAIPRFANRGTFDARGFFDQSSNMLRYAQKTAIAQRRAVFVNISGSAICLSYVADPACTDTANGVPEPTKNAWFSKDFPSDVSATSVSFSFTALGQPNPNQQVNISFSAPGLNQNVVVERETGYVH